MSGKADYRDASRIEHMYAALCRVKELFAGITRAEFVEGNSTAELILYHLIILGEAANNVSDGFCELHSEVDFRDMAGLRHKLVHDYANIDMSRIWQVLVDDVPVWCESIKPVCEALPQPVGMPPNLSDFD
ncbi:MAG: DUF86 domain-containing protein [Kiritimatiellae bacterium]|jgi:uncharacterized protein with HEPN domain|nr:DUF86 domain-containing protein [Kiritimatiellia bacterium]